MIQHIPTFRPTLVPLVLKPVDSSNLDFTSLAGVLVMGAVNAEPTYYC